MILTTGLPGFILPNKDDRFFIEIMKEKPRDTKESFFNKDLLLEVLIFSTTISFMIFI